jgi:mono/diheme cytochrome c family protein
MPAWRGRLSDTEVDDLIAYVRLLAGAKVPDDARARSWKRTSSWRPA